VRANWPEPGISSKKRYYDSLILVGDESRTLAHYQSEFGDFRILDGLLPRIRAVTAQDVQVAAVNYLTLQNTSVHEYEPQRAQSRTFTPESYSELVGVFAPSALGPIRPEEVKSATALRPSSRAPSEGLRVKPKNLLVADQPLPVKDILHLSRAPSIRSRGPRPADTRCWGLLSGWSPPRRPVD
jgi:hypothetical protein